MLALVGQLVYSKDWIKLTEENQISYFDKNRVTTQNYFKSVLVEQALLEGGLL